LSDLPDNIILVQKTTASGDDCHFNVTNISNSAAKKISKNIKLSDCLMCINGVAEDAEKKHLPTLNDRARRVAGL
jgi:hypothetical protein